MTKRFRAVAQFAVMAVSAVVAALCNNVRAAQSPDASTDEFFEKRIRPVLVERCYKCHSAQAEKLRGGLLLDSRTGILKGGDSGPAIVPRDVNSSLLIKAIRYKDEKLQMPPKEKLAENIVADFETWIRMGAPDPRSGTNTADDPVKSAFAKRISDGRNFWSFAPPKVQPLPGRDHSRWAKRQVDDFVQDKLEKTGLKPSPRTDARTLIRRATFDLSGLPPTPDEVQSFVADKSPDAYEKLIERLLASPQYGERWARTWLDKSRYADALAAFETTRGSPWLYRDWVINAFRTDMPYTDFVRRQLATDLMANSSPRDLPALGFLGLSPTYWKELMLQKSLIQNVVAEEWEERMDALGRTFLGLTVACARCHDHKFDPISQADYYALAGVLASTRQIDRPLIPEKDFEPVRQARKQVGDLEAQLEKLRKKDGKDKTPEPKEKIAELESKIRELKKNTPGYDQLMANAVGEAALFVLDDGPNKTKLDYHPGEARDLRIHLRGNPSNEGKTVPRGFIEVLSRNVRHEFHNGSGRLELADAIVTEGAPLSARVIVNRIWEQHFGRGLVDTPSNFGARGSRPSHPELLDDLTARFMQNGWSLKWLHREIMLSATYQQCSDSIAANVRADPENRLLWRMNRRRLDVEAWRDSLLAVSGSLDLRFGGAAQELSENSNVRRTIYGSIIRTKLNDLLRLYDFPDPSIHGEQRVPTTTPLQQLYVLNSDFIRHQSENLFARLQHETQPNLVARVKLAHQLLFSRTATPREISWAADFIQPNRNKSGGSEKDWQLYLHALLGSNEFMFVD